MDGKIDIFTLLFLVLAVIIILRLRSVLGRKSSEDDARVERYKAEQRARAAAGQGQDKIVTLPRRDRPDATPEKAAAAATADIEEKVRTLASGNEPLADGLLSVARSDASFDPEHFLVGARQAYEMIVTAFAEANRKTLKGLLSKDVYEGFSAALTDREGRGEQIDQSFVGINKADIVEAELKGGMAHVTVRFASELISATRDREGTVIAGDPKRIKEVIDIWTFARDVGSRDPNWKLVATQAPG
jgi:predicted lipid-binding transport protein (Tim44 family)